jgi:hypothetical protein
MVRWLPILFGFACSEYGMNKTTSGASGGEPRIEVDPIFVDYGLIPLDDASPTLELVTISNVGEAPLLVYNATLIDPAGPFSVVALRDVLIDEGTALDLVIEFTPSVFGLASDQVIISSNDPVDPEFFVDLKARVPPHIDDGVPDLWVNPLFHNFGVLPVLDVVQTDFTVSNIGDANLTISDLRFVSASAEMTLNIHWGVNGPLPWTLNPAEERVISVSYTPTDDTPDTAKIIVLSDDPDTAAETINLAGNGRVFSGFSTGWYVYDDGLDHETTSHPDYSVTSHGDYDLYWYEPSGAHGLIDSSDAMADFAVMREHVITGAGAPTAVTGPITFSSSSHLATYAFATYTYVACDFWIEPGEDAGIYTVNAEAVDDGIQVMVNGEILGRMSLGSTPMSWSLADVGRPGEVNTLIVILVDDSASQRYLNNLSFYRDGVMVE